MQVHSMIELGVISGRGGSMRRCMVVIQRIYSRIVLARGIIAGIWHCIVRGL